MAITQHVRRTPFIHCFPFTSFSPVFAVKKYHFMIRLKAGKKAKSFLCFGLTHVPFQKGLKIEEL